MSNLILFNFAFYRKRFLRLNLFLFVFALIFVESFSHFVKLILSLNLVFFTVD